MFRLALLSTILALALGQKKFCCTPDQWEGCMREVADSMAAGASQLVKKIAYTIRDGVCTHTKLTGDMLKFCVPDNATLAGKITYGLGKQSLDVQTYFIPVDNDTSVFETTTTTNPCVPIGEVLYGTPNKVSTVQTLAYYNFTPGIKDPKVFDPPPSCKGQTHMEQAPDVSDLMKFFRAKVTKHRGLP